MIPCQDVMRSNVITCLESDPVDWAAVLMRDFDLGFLAVVDANGTLVGVVTERDLVAKIVAERRSRSTEVREVMTKEILSCRPDDDLRDVEKRMVAAGRSRIAVVDSNGMCVGVLTLADLARVDRYPHEGAWLHDVRLRDSEPELRGASFEFTT